MLRKCLFLWCLVINLPFLLRVGLSLGNGVGNGLFWEIHHWVMLTLSCWSMGCSITRSAMTGVKLWCSFIGEILVFSARLGWFFLCWIHPNESNIFFTIFMSSVSYIQLLLHSIGTPYKFTPKKATNWSIDLKSGYHIKPQWPEKQIKRKHQASQLPKIQEHQTQILLYILLKPLTQSNSRNTNTFLASHPRRHTVRINDA